MDNKHSYRTYAKQASILECRASSYSGMIISKKQRLNLFCEAAYLWRIAWDNAPAKSPNKLYYETRAIFCMHESTHKWISSRRKA